MSHYLNHPEIYNQPILLTEEEKQSPTEILRRFCQDYDLSDLRAYIWNQVEVCLTSDNSLYNEPEKKADLLYLKIQMEKMLEAVYLLV